LTPVAAEAQVAAGVCDTSRMASVAELARAELMQAVCAVACSALEARAASVAVVDRKAGEFFFVAASGDADDLVGGRFRMTEGIAGRALTSGKPVIVADTSSDPEFARHIAVASGFEPDAIAVMPLIVAGRVSAVLSVLDPAGGVDAESLERITALAEHAATGMAVVSRLAGSG
jgi:GAF domain-containing protein